MVCVDICGSFVVKIETEDGSRSSSKIELRLSAHYVLSPLDVPSVKMSRKKIHVLESRRSEARRDVT